MSKFETKRNVRNPGSFAQHLEPVSMEFEAVK
jgi:hypothetical protein